MMLATDTQLPVLYHGPSIYDASHRHSATSIVPSINDDSHIHSATNIVTSINDATSHRQSATSIVQWTQAPQRNAHLWRNVLELGEAQTQRS